jgi:hypothetical protein
LQQSLPPVRRLDIRRDPPPLTVEELGARFVVAAFTKVVARENGPVTLFGQPRAIGLERKMPMALVLVMTFNISVALALGFVFGRIYQIRRYMLERSDGFALLPTASIPRR